VIVSLPTGTGKTVVFAHFPRVLNMKKRLLVLAHREELLLQARDKFRSIDPELKAEIEQAGARAAADAKVVIASVPTLARNGGRLSRLQPDEFSIIVSMKRTTPSHPATGASRSLRAVRILRFPLPDRLHCHPRRGDKQGLAKYLRRSVTRVICAR